MDRSKKVLFVSIQGAMGHVTRDLAIARELRRAVPGVEIAWLAHRQAAQWLARRGETVLPEVEHVGDYNVLGSRIVNDFRLDLVGYIRITAHARRANARLVERVQRERRFALVVGDEIYETMAALAAGEIRIDCPVVMIEDFLRVEALGWNPLVRLAVWRINRRRLQELERTAAQVTHLFVGEPEDIPAGRYGFLLSRCRDVARRHYRVIGHVVRFDPAELRDREALRRKLGYGPGPLVICATGGTAAGKELLALCGRALPLLRREMPDLQVTFVCGEVYRTAPPELPPGATCHRFLDNIEEHYAACDLAVVVGGGTTSIELTALERPFLFFPLENQFDQQINVAGRVARHGAGVRMEYRTTTPEELARAIRENLGRRVDATGIPFDGARRGAQAIAELLDAA